MQKSAESLYVRLAQQLPSPPRKKGYSLFVSCGHLQKEKNLWNGFKEMLANMPRLAA